MHRSPVSRERIGLGNYISLARTLPISTYQPCKRDGIGMHSLATVVGQSWG